MNDALILRLGTVGGFLACGSSSVIGGIPRQRFRKEIIRSGKYIDPKSGLEFEVDNAALRHWPIVFSAMRSNGVKVPIPMSGHVKSEVEDQLRRGEADTRNAGWVEEMFSDSDSLFMVCQIIGADAIAAVARNDVSIYSPPSWTDGRGIRYTRPITHVALCPDPLIPGLGEFIPLAASRVSQPQMITDTESPLVADANRRAGRGHTGPTTIAASSSGAIAQRNADKAEKLTSALVADADARAERQYRDSPEWRALDALSEAVQRRRDSAAGVPDPVVIDTLKRAALAVGISPEILKLIEFEQLPTAEAVRQHNARGAY